MSTTKRQFLQRAAAFGAGILTSGYGLKAAAEPPPEIRRLRLVQEPSVCMAPQYIADALLRAEGFTDIVYVQNNGSANFPLLNNGQADMTMDAAPAIVAGMESSPQCIALAGIHAGCYELFAQQGITSLRALKGRRIAVSSMGGGAQVFLASVRAYIGLDPRRDVSWMVDEKSGDALQRFTDGRADAFMAFAPQPQDLRAKGLGRVILDTAVDKPWSQYFCCMLMARREFVKAYPNATRRALRAILKATDICASQPEMVARDLVRRGFEPRFEVSLEILRSLPYARWRQADPEDTLRFHALRLHEVGMVRTSPNVLVQRSVDWSFLHALRGELKA